MAGKEYSVDIYVAKDGQPKGAVARSRDIVAGGESQVTTIARMPKLEALSKKLAAKLKLYGHLVLQVIQDKERKFHILECNSRFGGASTLSVKDGLDSFYWFLLEAQGASLDNYPFIRTGKSLRQIRFSQDLIVDGHNS